MTQQPLYSVHNLVRSFAGREVLHIDQLSLEKGTIYGLLGPNGAGKTTLMKLLAFIDTPSAGEIYFMGQPVSPAGAAALRSKVVWVPQHPVMFTGTLLYNIEYPMALKKVPRQERSRKALELLESVRLGHLAQSPARKLSGGEAQRASIARALAAGAEVILFDEPTASVDFRSRGEIIRLLRSLQKERGLSLVVTSHDAALAEELCDTCITLFDGYLVPGKARGCATSTELLPGLLRQEANGSLVLVLPAGAYPTEPQAVCSGFVQAKVSGLWEEGADIVLRLLFANGQSKNIALAGAAENRLVEGLTLGGALQCLCAS